MGDIAFNCDSVGSCVGCSYNRASVRIGTCNSKVILNNQVIADIPTISIPTKGKVIKSSLTNYTVVSNSSKILCPLKINRALVLGKGTVSGPALPNGDIVVIGSYI